MGNALITRRGGGGGLKSTDAILRVIAPAGSTVTISKGGVSKSDLGHENASDPTLYDYYFIIHASQFDSVNPWTVTATLGSDTATDTVVIDSADEYDVVLYYRFYIMKDGSYIEETITKYQGSAEEVIGTGYRIYRMTDSNWSTWFTGNQVDVTPYTSMVVVLTGGKTRFFDRFGLRDTKTALNSQTVNIFTVASVSTGQDTVNTVITERTELRADITAINGSYWFGFTIEGTKNFTDADYKNGGFKVTDMYFEQ